MPPTNEDVSPGSEAGRLHLGRYLIAAAACSAWLMIFALHIPVRSVLPQFELICYPSFVYFMPLSVLYGTLLPWSVTDPRALVGMMGLDAVISALLCLPFLYPKGPRQDVLAVVSLAFLFGYTILTVCFYLMRSY